MLSSETSDSIDVIDVREEELLLLTTEPPYERKRDSITSFEMHSVFQ
jgi:hypothetical protein